MKHKLTQCHPMDYLSWELLLIKLLHTIYHKMFIVSANSQLQQKKKEFINESTSAVNWEF